MIKNFLLAIVSLSILFSTPVMAEEKDDLRGAVGLLAYVHYCGAEINTFAHIGIGLILSEYDEENVTAMKKRASDKYNEVGKHKFCTVIKKSLKSDMQLNSLITKHYSIF